jgi:hypothetical protein
MLLDPKSGSPMLRGLPEPSSCSFLISGEQLIAPKEAATTSVGDFFDKPRNKFKCP